MLTVSADCSQIKRSVVLIEVKTGAYMYVGLAVRTALAMGINREPGPGVKKEPAQLRAETRTWW